MMLTQHELKEILDYNPETGVFTWKRRAKNPRAIKYYSALYVGTNAGTVNAGRLIITIKRKHWKAHRLAWLYVYGEVPSEIDHINGDTLDNTISNLRVASRVQNCSNTKARVGSSVFKGVFYCNTFKTWKSCIHSNGKKTYIGSFDDDVSAAIAYDAMARKIHGAFARLNFPLGN